jgi:hypothetical protein
MSGEKLILLLEKYLKENRLLTIITTTGKHYFGFLKPFNAKDNFFILINDRDQREQIIRICDISSICSNVEKVNTEKDMPFIDLEKKFLKINLEDKDD